MDKDTLDFFCKGTGYNWYYQLLSALELAEQQLNKIRFVISGYEIKTRINLRVGGLTNDGEFLAIFELSDNWSVPVDTIYSLKELRYYESNKV